MWTGGNVTELRAPKDMTAQECCAGDITAPAARPCSLGTASPDSRSHAIMSVEAARSGTLLGWGEERPARPVSAVQSVLSNSRREQVKQMYKVSPPSGQGAPAFGWTMTTRERERRQASPKVAD